MAPNDRDRRKINALREQFAGTILPETNVGIGQGLPRAPNRPRLRELRPRVAEGLPSAARSARSPGLQKNGRRKALAMHEGLGRVLTPNVTRAARLHHKTQVR